MYKKLNFATGVLASGITDSATEIILKAGHTITTGTGETNKFVGVFFDKTKSSPFQDVNREIVEAYRTGTNTFTITRAKEGTSAKSWVEDDNFMLIASSAVFDEYEAELNNKQDALGFTPENITNKKTTITDSDTDYPTGRAVKTALDGKEPTLTKGNLSGSGVITIDNTRQVIGGAATISHTDSATVRHVTDTEKATWNAKQNALGYTPENIANKKTSLTDNSDTYYPTQKAVKTAVDAKQDALGFTPENVANKKTSLADNSDTYYPSQKAVKTAVDAKAPIASPTLTGTVTLPKAVNIKDTSADHEYQLGVSELAANRTITLPLLTGNDEFVFKAHTQTLTNKRINPRIVSATSYTTDTGTSLNISTCDQFVITAQAGALKFNNPGGTPLNGQKLIIRIKDNGTARALTYDTQFRGIGVELPDTTVAGKTLYMGFIYNSNDTKWDLVASAQEE